MYSHRSEYSSHRRRDADSSSGQWDEWDERSQTLSKYQRDVCHSSCEDGPSSTQRRSRTRESRGSSRDSLSRDSHRRSPSRRRGSSPVKRRRTCVEDQDFSYRHRSLEEAPPEEFRPSLPHGDRFQLRRTPPEFRAGRQRREDSSDRSFSGCFSDEDFPKRRRDSSPERTGSPGRFTKKYPGSRERLGSPHTSGHYEDYQSRSSRQSSEGDVASRGSSAPERKLSAGFQRFLDVLNMGVNVDALSKIVSQTSAEVSAEYVSQSPLAGAAGASRSPGCPERPRRSRRRDGSSSPSRTPASDENLPQRSLSSKSPSAEKLALTPEEEAKRKQMQDVLQAIGVDLGLDELGQMTHRIQERLYGKRNDERGQNQDRTLSPRHRSRSSSSGSSFSPPSRDRYEAEGQGRPPRVLSELKQSTEYERRINRGSFQGGEDKPAAAKASAPKRTLTQLLSVSAPASAPAPAPAPASAPPPVTSPTLTYPPHFPGVPPPFPPTPPPFFPSAPPPLFPPAPPPFFPPGPTPPPFTPRFRPGAFPPFMPPNPLLCNPFRPGRGPTGLLIPPPFAPPPFFPQTPQYSTKNSAKHQMSRCLLVVKSNKRGEKNK